VRFSEEGGDTLRIHTVKNRKDPYRRRLPTARRGTRELQRFITSK
jgi:hypothetical protein